MSKILPQFPLQLVVFPGEELNLHIFEPRYKQLIQDCKTENSQFGIPTVIKNSKPSVGTIVELVKVVKTYGDGKMDIRCKGKDPYKIQSFIDPMENKLYAGAKIEFMPVDQDDGEFILNQKIIEKVLELYRFMKIDREIIEDASLFNVFQVAHKIGLTLRQELELLSIDSANLRQEFVYDHLVNLLPVVQKMELMRKKIQMNGHFKNLGAG